MLKGFHYVPAHRSFAIEGKITNKYVIKGVKVTQKLVFGLKKMLKMAHFGVIMTSHVEIASHWNLKSASIAMLDISPWD